MQCKTKDEFDALREFVIHEVGLLRQELAALRGEVRYTQQRSACESLEATFAQYRHR